MKAPKADWAFRAHLLALSCLKWALEIHALVSRRKFFCSTLSEGATPAGFSYGTLTVNSDLSVSCTCVDLDGSGKLGSLREETIPGMLSGPRASAFRGKLARGKLPTPWCVQCVARRSAPRAEAQSIAAKSPARVKQLGVENTSLCNYLCTTCDRVSVGNNRTQPALTSPQMERISRLAAKAGVEKIIFANLGEPFLSRRLGEELRALREHNPGAFIETSTNGSVVDSDAKREAAMSFDRIYFSIHGVSQRQLDRYQKKGDFTLAFENMKRLVEFRNSRGLSRPEIHWRYVIFNWNDRPRDLQTAIRLAREAQVDGLEFSYAIRPFYGVSWRFFLPGFWRTKGFASREGIPGRRILNLATEAR